MAEPSLKKREKSARYVSVRDEKFMYDVLKKLRSLYPNDWIYALGSYHPSRHEKFEELNLFGGDYKGWIFNYIQKEKTLEKISDKLNRLESNFKSKKLCEYKDKFNKISKKILVLKNKKRNLYKYDPKSKEAGRLYKKIKILSEKKEELFIKIFKIRNKSLYLHKDETYLNLMKQFEELSVRDAQKYRFTQVRTYLNENVYSKMKKYLLLISCSETKKSDDGLLPAFERYNGPFYLTLKKIAREYGIPSKLDIKIISAKYGLIDKDHPIENYDLKMDKNIALQWRPKISSALKNLISTNKYDEIFINLGEEYQKSLDGAMNTVPSYTKVDFADGPIGIRQSKMKKWVEDKSFYR